MHQGIVDGVVGGETRGSEIGHRIVLPTSFIGGPRITRKRYLDAIALVKAFGKPDLFLTITCNPEWKEIKENLFDGQVAHDRPDLVSRVFRSKLIDLKYQVLKKCIFGRVAAYVCIIEFQKRGLPHCHMLLILSTDSKISSPEMFDSYVVAEIPDENRFPKLFHLVTRRMMHGPCGLLDKKCPCMINGKCKLASDTTITNPVDALLNENYKVLFKLNHFINKRGPICSIEAEGVEKFDDNLNRERKIRKRKLTKKSKSESQSIIIEDKKGTNASSIKLAKKPRNKKQIEIDNDGTLRDYTKRIRSQATSNSKVLLG